MAGIKLLTRKQSLGEQVEPAPEPDQSTLLGHVGSAFHTVGSLLSAPSRVAHGTLNALTGGEGGFGNMNPFDSTGGIEGSQHLVRLGILPKNDPSQWELHDFTRGVADLGLDPASWIGIGGLTKAGVGASKTLAGATKGIVPSIAAGERALINLRSPLGHSLGDIGHGAQVADALRGVGKVASKATDIAVSPIAKRLKITPREVKAGIAEAVAKPVRTVTGLFDARMRNMTDPTIQKILPEHVLEVARRERGHTAVGLRITRSMQKAQEAHEKAFAAIPKSARSGVDVYSPMEELHLRLEGVPLAYTRPELDKHVNELGALFADQLAEGKRLGTGYSGKLNDPAISGYAPRFKTMPEGDSLIGPKGKNGNKAVKRYWFLKGNTQGTHGIGGTNDVIQTAAQVADAALARGLSKKDAWREAAREIDKRFSANIPVKKVMVNGTERSRIAALAKYATENSKALSKNSLFANVAISDVLKGMGKHLGRADRASLVTKAIAADMNSARALKNGVTIKQAFEKIGLRKEAADEIARLAGHGPFADDAARRAFMNNNLVHSDMITQLKTQSPIKGKTPAGEEAANTWAQMLNWFKAGVLAYPATHFRNFASAGLQNMLHGLFGKGEGYGDAARLMTGQTLKGNYHNIDFVKDWFNKTGLPKTQENMSEAVRQMVAVHHPKEHGFLGDLPQGQLGFQMKDVLRNVPGQTPTTLKERFITNPLRALKEGSWNPLDMLDVRGVGGRTESGLAPIKASELFGEATDSLHRPAAFLQQLQHDVHPEVAMNRANAAQIDYNPATFSDQEKWIKRNVAPFYSFGSRIVPTTTRQLADLGSPTSQMIKAQDRAYSGNPAVPDYILDSTGIPLGKDSDGTLRYLTGLGAMHEPAVKMIGQAAAGDLRGLGFGTASMLAPFFQAPSEYVTQRSFSRDGEPTMNLDSNTGRVLSNIGELTGLREVGQGPVKYPGRDTLDFALSMTPFGRAMSQLRQATDTRRGPGKLLTQEEPITPLGAAYDLTSGIAPLASGIRITDVSPGKQTAELRKRAEEVLHEAGGRSRTEVYFPKDALAKLRETDPVNAARAEAIQKYINGLKKANVGGKKAEKETKKKLIKITPRD